MRYFLSTLTLTALASSCVTALGINCRGNSGCSDFTAYDKTKGKTDAMKLRDIILREVRDGDSYRNDDYIGCLFGPSGSRICAFLKDVEDPNGIQGNRIKVLAQRIVQHGCHVCGNVPVYFDNHDNDVSHGELSFNYSAP